MYAIPCVGDEMSESARDGRRRLIAQWRERAAKIASNSEGMTQLVTLQDFLANRVITFNECADQLEALDALAGEGRAMEQEHDDEQQATRVDETQSNHPRSGSTAAGNAAIRALLDSVSAFLQSVEWNDRSSEEGAADLVARIDEALNGAE